MTESPRERLHRLIAELRADSLDTKSFCHCFETTYNLELDKQTLTPVEAEFFAELFEQVIWYSPFPDERAQIPHDRSEAGIALAVEQATQRFVAKTGIAGRNDTQLSALEIAVVLEFSRNVWRATRHRAVAIGRQSPRAKTR